MVSTSRSAHASSSHKVGSDPLIDYQSTVGYHVIQSIVSLEYTKPFANIITTIYSRRTFQRFLLTDALFQIIALFALRFGVTLQIFDLSLDVR